jgi:hypothetical protein
MNSNKTSLSNPTLLRDLDKFDDILDEHFSNDQGAKQGAKLTGRKRPDQSVRMSGSNNSMAGKEHPNKGKTMPQIGEKIRGKKKHTEESKSKIGAVRKGKTNLHALGKERPEHSNLMKTKNPMFRPIRTPHGDFDSIRFVIFDEKARGMKNAERRVRQLLTIPGSGYEYIDR